RVLGHFVPVSPEVLPRAARQAGQHVTGLDHPVFATGSSSLRATVAELLPVEREKLLAELVRHWLLSHRHDKDASILYQGVVLGSYCTLDDPDHVLLDESAPDFWDQVQRRHQSDVLALSEKQFFNLLELDEEEDV